MASQPRLLLFVLFFFVLVGGGLAFLALRDIPPARHTVETPIENARLIH